MIRLRVHNRSGYATESLRSLFERGLRAFEASARGRRQARTGELHVMVVPAPARSRGCATVRGQTMVIAIAPPSRFRLRRLANVFYHELRHHFGDEHEALGPRALYSDGPTPRWAKGAILYYNGRAPNQGAAYTRGR